MMNSIPNDYILEIFSRLPAKSIMRFHFVLKLWRSILSGQYFTELFLTRSSARPHLLFAIQGIDERECHFFSTPQPHNPSPHESSLVVDADSYMNCPEDMLLEFGGYASGLFYLCHNVWIHNKIQNVMESLSVICNPSTGQCVFLPRLQSKSRSMCYLGFDPIGKQFKLLCMVSLYFDDEHRTLTLSGTGGDMSWRKIQSPAATLSPFRLSNSVCIKCVLYYLTQKSDEWIQDYYVIVCFDVRSEKIVFIKAQSFYEKLINYKGKLGGITLKYEDGDDGFSLTYLSMWVLEDVEKQEWSEYSYTLPHHKFDPVGCSVSVVGVIVTGEIVLSMDENIPCKPFYVFYFHPERKSLQRVEIQGFENPGRVFVFVDHVEDLNLNNATFLKSSISDPSIYEE